MAAFGHQPRAHAALGAEDIEAYLATGEWQGKAGGYAIQGSRRLYQSSYRVLQQYCRFALV